MYIKKLRNKSVLITGASSGIGQAIAIAYAAEGANVAFSYHSNVEGMKNTLDEIKNIGNVGFAFSASMADNCSIYKLVEDVIGCLGSIDILVNNAGMVTRFKDFLDISIKSLDEIQAVNLRAPFILTQEVAKCMKERDRGGCIINISSMSADIVSPGLTHYECSKAALHALTRGAAGDLAKYNIRVNAIAPGLVATNINHAQRENDLDAWIQRSSKIPLGRTGMPKDIASLAVFLASEEASWMTGSIIPFDGGIGIASPF